MEIVLNNKYTIKSDARQYILVETLDKKENMWYFTSLNGVVKYLIIKRIRMNSKIKTLTDLSKKIDDYAKEISEQIKNIDIG